MKVIGKEADYGWEIERMRWGFILVVIGTYSVICDEKIAGRRFEAGDVVSIIGDLALLSAIFQPPD